MPDALEFDDRAKLPLLSGAGQWTLPRRRPDLIART